MAEPTAFRGRMVKWLLAGVFVMMMLTIIDHAAGRPYWPISRTFTFGHEGNLPTWYSSLLLAIGGVAAWRCYRLAKSNGWRRAWTLGAFSALLWFMSCDEVSQFHEGLGQYAARFVGVADKSYALNSPWVWVFGPLILLAFLAFIVALWEPLGRAKGCRRLLLLGLGSIVLGGILVEGTINFMDHQRFQTLWTHEVIPEETLEMIGSVLLIYTFVRWETSVQAARARGKSATLTAVK